MAEVKIEKKRVIWPWLLVALITIALVIYFLLSNFRKDELAVTDNTEHINHQENNSTVASFVSFVNNNSNTMSLDHAYTNEALLKLAEAIKAVADKIGYNVGGDLDKVKEYAFKITNDPFETTHADNIRSATDILSSSLEKMQQMKYPELSTETGDLKKASSSINPDVLTLDQKDAVKSFFKKAAELIKKMN